MRIVIAGGHGKVALLLSEILATAGHEPVGLIRNPAPAAEVKATGATPLVLDLESSDVASVAFALAGANAVVFAAGAGAGSGPERKQTVDRDGAILLADAADAAGVLRFVVISSIGADGFATAGDDMGAYLKAKSEADAYIRESALDWTIVRPGPLTDEAPTGLVTVGDDSLERGEISRADVARVVATAIDEPATLRQQFVVVGGAVAVSDALKSLVR